MLSDNCILAKFLNYRHSQIRLTYRYDPIVTSVTEKVENYCDAGSTSKVHVKRGQYSACITGLRLPSVTTVLLAHVSFK